MSYDSISNITSAALWASLIIANVWLVFFAPARTRSWPFFLRVLLPAAGFQIAVYAIYYCFLYPSTRQFVLQHPNTLICGGPIRIRPHAFFLFGAIVSLVLFHVPRLLQNKPAGFRPFRG